MLLNHHTKHYHCQVKEFDLRSMFDMHHTVAGTWLLKHTLPWVQLKCVNLWVVVLVVLPKEAWPRGGTIGAP